MHTRIAQVLYLRRELFEGYLSIDYHCMCYTCCINSCYPHPLSLQVHNTNTWVGAYSTVLCIRKTRVCLTYFFKFCHSSKFFLILNSYFFQGKGMTLFIKTQFTQLQKRVYQWIECIVKPKPKRVEQESPTSTIQQSTSILTTVGSPNYCRHSGKHEFHFKLPSATRTLLGLYH